MNFFLLVFSKHVQFSLFHSISVYVNPTTIMSDSDNVSTTSKISIEKTFFSLFYNFPSNFSSPAALCRLIYFLLMLRKHAITFFLSVTRVIWAIISPLISLNGLQLRRGGWTGFSRAAWKGAISYQFGSFCLTSFFSPRCHFLRQRRPLQFTSSHDQKTNSKQEEKLSTAQFNIKPVERVVLSTFQFWITVCLHTSWTEGGTRVFQLFWLGARWLGRNGTFCAARKGLRKSSQIDLATGRYNRKSKLSSKLIRLLIKSTILYTSFLSFRSPVPFIASQFILTIRSTTFPWYLACIRAVKNEYNSRFR